MRCRDIHKHGVDLYIRNVSFLIDQKFARGSLTDIFQVLLANLDQRRGLLDFLGWQLRKTCRKDDVVSGIQRLVPEGTPFYVVWTFILELPTEGIPETCMANLSMGVYTENRDC